MHGFNSELSILFHRSMSIFMPIAYFVDYYSFITELEIKEHDDSSFIVPQDCLGYSGSLWFHTNFTIICSGL